MGSLAPYLPPHLVDALARRGAPSRLPAVERFPAALLLSDISGFTSLTERLQQRGREGAEEIASVVSEVFAPCIGAVGEGGGSIATFGGDALLSLFRGRGAVARARECARKIGASVAARGAIETSAGRVTLSITQAVHHGMVHGLHLGEGRRRAYLTAGPAPVALVRMKHATPAGRVRVSVRARERAAAEGPAVAAQRWRVARDATLAAYVPPRLLPSLGRSEGAFRHAAVLFLESRGGGVGELHAFFRILDAALERYEGLLLKTDVSDRGSSWVCLFGIPAAHEDDATRAGRCALELLAAAPRTLPLRGGLHAGVVVNLEVGTAQRRSFDVLGDVVNSAARAMASARPGEVLAVAGCLEELDGLETRARGARRVRGKAQPLVLHALAGVRRAGRRLHLETPLAGRREVMEDLVRLLDAAATGRGAAVAIVGAAGIGKSRLAHELSEVAAGRGFDVLRGRAEPYAGARYGALAEALEPLPGDGGEPGLPELDRRHLAVVRGQQPPPAELDGASVRLNNRIAVATLMELRGRRRPQLAILDDMHHADELSREVVDALARRAGEMRLLLLLLQRPAEALPRAAQVVELPELGGDDVELMLRAQLGAVPPAVALLVRERCAGNPLYVEEVVRHLRDARLLERGPDGGSRLLREPGVEDVPASLGGLLASRLDALTPAARGLLQRASVFGGRFPASFLEGGVARDAYAAVRELLERDVLVRPAPGLLAFRHSLARDAAYGEILGARRRSLHREAAVAIEAAPALAGSFAPALGRHWELAGELERALPCYLASARRSLEAFAHEDAERHLRAYLAIAPEGSAAAVAARNELGARVLQVLGRAREAEQEHRRALEGARRLGDSVTIARTLGWLGDLHKSAGRLEEARACVQEALRVLPRGHGEWSRAVMIGNLATVTHEQGRIGEAGRLYRRVASMARAAGDRRTEAIAFGNLAIVAHASGRHREARRLYRASIAATRASGAIHAESAAVGNLGLLALQQGRLAEAERHLRESLRLDRRSGSRRALARTLGNLGGVLVARGRIEEAEPLVAESVALSRTMEDRATEAFDSVGLAMVRLLLSSDLQAARTACAQTLALFEVSGRPEKRGLALCLAAQLELASGRSGAELLEQARRVEGGPEPDLGRAVARLSRAEDAFAAGEPLLLGLRPEDHEPGELAWIAARRPEAIPAGLAARVRATLARRWSRRPGRPRRRATRGRSAPSAAGARASGRPRAARPTSRGDVRARSRRRSR